MSRKWPLSGVCLVDFYGVMLSLSGTNVLLYKHFFWTCSFASCGIGGAASTGQSNGGVLPFCVALEV